MAMLGRLADAYERLDNVVVPFADVRALVKRWLDAQTFAPREGNAGVHVVDAASACFGDFDLVQLAGLVEGEWPDASRRNIFYSTSVLRELGWPAEQERLQAARAAFADLLTLPAERLVVSTFQLEADTAVAASPLVDEVTRAELDVIEEAVPACRIFDHEVTSEATRGVRGSKDVPVYASKFAVRYDVAGVETFSSGFGTATRLSFGSPGPSRRALDQFQVGSTHPCWYDPEDVKTVLLARSPGGADLFAVIPRLTLAYALTLLRSAR
jgi:hypothetical protein